MKYTALIFALFLGLSTSAQAREIRTWQELGVYVGEQTAKINELQTKLRFQQGLIDAQAAQIQLHKDTFNTQRIWQLDYNCKWNKLLLDLSRATGPNPAVGPPVSKACDLISPAPVYPPAIP